MSTFLVSDDAADRIVIVESLTALGVDCHLDGDTLRFDGEPGAVFSANRRYRASIDDAQVALWTEGTWKRFAVGPAVAARQADDRTGEGGDCIAADLPGVVTQLLVDVDQSVTAGTPVIVVEAMKLFHTLVAPRDGVIAHIRVAIGATVDRGAVLVELAPATV